MLTNTLRPLSDSPTNLNKTTPKLDDFNFVQTLYYLVTMTLVVLSSFSLSNISLSNSALSNSEIVNNQQTLAKNNPEQAFKLSSNHTLLLKLPPSWQSQINYLVKYYTPTITLASQQPHANFKALITPISIESQSISPDSKQLFGIVDNMLTHIKQQNHNQIINIESLRKKNQLYYFHIEKQKKQSKEYAYIVQGGINIKGIICAFTIMSKEKDSKAIHQILEILADAQKLDLKENLA